MTFRLNLQKMSRILAIDYGLKRTGLAVSDPMQLIASPLDTVPTTDLMEFLKTYFERENVTTIVLGLPKNLNGTLSEMANHVLELEKTLKSLFPEKSIFLVDERFTSKIATDSLVRGGMKKKDRQVKAHIDKVSATLLLQSFMERNR